MNKLSQHLKYIRTSQNLTLNSLAEKTGISRATLSRIENNDVSPTAETLGALSTAFGISISQLLAPLENNFLPLIKCKAQEVWQDEINGYTRRQISPQTSPLNIEIIEGCIEPNQNISYDKPTFSGHEHHLVMLTGELFLTVEGNEYHLFKGDCLRYKLFGSTNFQTKQEPATYLIAMNKGA